MLFLHFSSYEFPDFVILGRVSSATGSSPRRQTTPESEPRNPRLADNQIPSDGFHRPEL
jgi:hypothetical protein